VVLIAVICCAVQLAPQSVLAAVRTYYIAADELPWNYAPLRRDVTHGKAIDPAGPDRIGTTYQKALYREYTNDSFSRLKPRLAADQYLGYLGPVIRAEVGDTIRVVFRNRGTHPYSLHPHGVFYTKANEGAPYNDGTLGHDRYDDAVAPGATYVYTWLVPPRAGPGPMDPNSIAWMYHSHVDEVRDVDSGLVGVIIVSRRGQLRANGLPKGVDREVIVSLDFDDENGSWFIDQNIQRYVKDATKAKGEGIAFAGSNQMMSINGFIDANMPPISLRRGEHVRWYVFGGMGTDLDFHVLHWHGATALINGMRTDMVELPVPGSMRVADMVPDAVGLWLFHCHVPGHTAEMNALFSVH
jgi:manganese oxidase